MEAYLLIFTYFVFYTVTSLYKISYLTGNGKTYTYITTLGRNIFNELFSNIIEILE